MNQLITQIDQLATVFEFGMFCLFTVAAIASVVFILKTLSGKE
jgi:hypothetical protein